MTGRRTAGLCVFYIRFQVYSRAMKIDTHQVRAHADGGDPTGDRIERDRRRRRVLWGHELTLEAIPRGGALDGRR